ncbi:MAG: hypothetical protein KA003_21505, partial [Caldilineaceae bacterium]|nr:hypothetical protein [Caldilineaceae bacterium]
MLRLAFEEFAIRHSPFAIRHSPMPVFDTPSTPTDRPLDLAVIILNFNTCALLRDCLTTVLAAEG